MTLEGVTIGNVLQCAWCPDRNPDPVEVTMQVGREISARPAHRFDCVHCHRPAYWATATSISIRRTPAGRHRRTMRSCKRRASPTIQEVISTSQVSIEEINRLMHKIEHPDRHSEHHARHGGRADQRSRAGQKNVVSIATNLQTMTGNIAQRAKDRWARSSATTRFIQQAELDRRSAELDHGRSQCRQRNRGQIAQRRDDSTTI